MSQTRYIYKTVPLSKEAADKQRSQEFEHIRDQVSELLKEMEELCDSPLPTTHQIQIELNSGDEGYEDAPYAMNFVSYQGNVTWKNIWNSTPPKPE